MADIYKSVPQTIPPRYRHVWLVIAYGFDSESIKDQVFEGYKIYGIFTELDEVEAAMDRAHSDGWANVIREDLCLDTGPLSLEEARIIAGIAGTGIGIPKKENG